MISTTTSETRETVARVRNAYVGRSSDGGRLFLSIDVRRVTGPARETIGPDVETIITDDGAETRRHVTVSDYYEISIMGAYMVKGSKRHDVDAGGQNLDDFAGAVVDPRASHWTRADIRSAVAIWRRWHLNGMKAGCAHVPDAVMETTKGYARPDLTATPACPETGYRWGHAWLVEPAPEDVVTELTRLCEIPRGNVPEWLD